MSGDDLRDRLRGLTAARLLLGRAGHALPTAAWLDLELAHARARDAVHRPWDHAALAAALAAEGHEVLTLATPVRSRIEYLVRPDLGRRLDAPSAARCRPHGPGPVDVALVLAGGLSALALDRHGFPLALAVIAALREAGLTLAPLVLIDHARVAVGDEIGEALGARLVVVLIGERPGLSAADSAGLYLTFAPRPGRTDAERNCISSIRPPEGLGYEEAARRLRFLALESLRRQLSGVDLKDESELLPGDDPPERLPG
jgi:ethanolamine ammonia-lyase small subunit